jgi:hypothetical protein
VWLAYVDESFDKTFHYVTALLVRDEVVNATQRALREVVESAADAYGIAEDAELHGYDVFQGENHFEPMKQLVRARIGVYQQTLDVLVDADVWVIRRGVNRLRLEARYIKPEHPHRVTMTHLIEQIDGLCKVPRGEDDLALIVADEHHETQSQLLRDLVIYQEHGTWGYLAKKITRVVDTIHFVNSNNNALVQGCDMVSFILFRRTTTPQESDPRAEKAMQALAATIEPRLHHAWCWYP